MEYKSFDSFSISQSISPLPLQFPSIPGWLGSYFLSLQPISMQLLWAGTSNPVVKIQTHTPPAFFFPFLSSHHNHQQDPKPCIIHIIFFNWDLLQGWWSLLEANLYLSPSTATIKFCSKSEPLSILWYSIHPTFSRISWFSQFLIIPHLYPVLLYWLLHL